jgi:hypothetical protein
MSISLVLSIIDFVSVVFSLQGFEFQIYGIGVWNLGFGV